MATIDAQIDELFQRPLSEFTAARNELAKTLSGDARRDVKELKKPTVVPWAINQLYWRARPIYDRLIKTGQALRDVQIAALKGKDVDLRRANEAHRKAVAEAVERATALAEADGSQPGAEPLSRMLEALSLAAEPPEHPGRFTEIVQPAGFEALTGVKPAARPAGRARSEAATSAKEDARARSREAARRRESEARIRDAERRLERARAAEAKARAAHDRAREELRDAEQTLAAARLGGAR